MTSPPRIAEYGDRYSVRYAGYALASVGMQVDRLTVDGEGEPERGPVQTALYEYLDHQKQVVPVTSTELADRLSVYDAVLLDGDLLLEECSGSADPLDWAQAHYPTPVVGVISTFGLTGPYRDWAGSDLAAQHFAGMAFTAPRGSLPDDAPPLRAGSQVSAIQAGIYAAIGTLVGLLSEERQAFEVSEYEAVLPYMLVPLRVWHTDRERARRGLNIYPFVEAKDGYICPIAVTDKQWESLCDLMGDPEWSRSEAFATFPGRLANADAIAAR